MSKRDVVISVEASRLVSGLTNLTSIMAMFEAVFAITMNHLCCAMTVLHREVDGHYQ